MDEQCKSVVVRWWQSMFLSPSELKEKHIPPAPTNYKAQLKRCASVDEAMLTEGFRSLWLSLPESVTGASDENGMECWATIATVLVFVKKDIHDSLAKAAGKKHEGDKPIVSELRFAQLQNANSPAELLTRLRRTVQLVKCEVNVASLALDISRWFEEHYHFKPRSADKRITVRWAMDYYRHASDKK